MTHRFELGDAFELLKTIPDNSVDACITDPPYFLDTLGDDWDTEVIAERKDGEKSTVKSLPGGMKFDRSQGYEFEKFMREISQEVFRVLKPGGFYVSFSQARMYHRLGVAVEDAGFEMRDMLGWTYSGQAKAFSQDHIIKKQKNLTEQQKTDLINELQGWKTPQLRPCIEPMTLAQKPTDGTYVNNWQLHRIGLVNVNERLNENFPGNLMPVAKPVKSEKGDYNNHVSVKPLVLIEHLIRLLTPDNATVLDPFLGSGTTLVACERTGRNCIGFELSPKYFEIIKQRLQDCQ